MSAAEAMSEAIEKFYTINRILNDLQKKPHTYASETLYANEAHTLKLIAQNEGISQSELSDRMFRTKGATSVVVDSLVSRGLVKREREQGNQRRYLLSITERGKEVHDAHIAYDTASAQRASIATGLSENQLAELSSNLDKLIEFYSSAYLDHGRAITDPSPK